MSNGHKKREDERIKPRTTKYFARFRVKLHEEQEISSPDWETVILRDISAGGALFFYKKDLGIGTLLDLKIYVTKDTHNINCVGKIIRIEKPKSTSMFGIAVKFIEIGEQEKELINKMAEGISE